MVITQSEALRRDAEYARRTANAGAIVESVAGPTAAEAEWDIMKDYWGHPQVRLHLRDGAVRGTADFTPHELQNLPLVEERVRRLRGGFDRIRRWRDQLAGLYADIREWCKDIPGAVVTTESITVGEEASGYYEVERLRVVAGDGEMTVEPVAAWAISFDGRVDLDGTGGPINLYAKDGGWIYVERFATYAEYKEEPLDRDLFLKLAREVLDG